MTAELLRDAAATAAVFGFFASAWFGWAQDQPPPAWRTAFDADTSRTFGLVVGIEVALAAIGAAVLARRRRSELIPAWVALVVGVHLFPVALLVRSPLIAVTAVLVTLVALAAVPLARSRSVAVSAVTGLGAGTVLLAAALWSLAGALLWP
jgi:hypothetical protein